MPRSATPSLRALARPSLAGTANVFAARAEALIVDDDAAATATVKAAPVVADVDDDDAPGLGGRVAADELPSLAALHKLVGLAEVKAYAQNLKDATTLEKERGDDAEAQDQLSCVLPATRAPARRRSPSCTASCSATPGGAGRARRAADGRAVAGRRAQGARRGARDV